MPSPDNAPTRTNVDQTGLLTHVQKMLLRAETDGMGDGALLTTFIERRDEEAFAALVRRHGPMVWGVGRRLLGDGPDAEDAFQAAFLLLARKATTVRPPDRVGNWL